MRVSKPSDELTGLSAAKLAALIRARAVSPVEVVEACLRRIEEANPHLNAVVTLAPDALERAREAEKDVTRGEIRSALHGVPLTVKDTIAVENLRATSGSRVLADFIAREDAPAVSRLRAAGAIILGKTNCSEMALDYTSDNPVFGRANNPHDLARTSGGSSGGCAAAVSACLTPLGLGSDLAGSIRIPAHFCGIAGLKPTAGRVPGAGHVPPLTGLHSLGASLGPLARNVEDLELMFRVLAGQRSAVDASGELDGVRVAWFTHDGVVPITEETKLALTNAVAALSDEGMATIEERPPGVERATELWLALFSFTTERFLRSVYAGREDEAGTVARLMLERASAAHTPTLAETLDVWDERDRLRAELLNWMEHTPLVVAPVGAVAAFRHEEAGRVEVCGQTFSTFRAFGYAQAFNVFDLPAACVPVGQTNEGLPIGVQIVGRPFEEERVLAAARIVEKALGGWQPPPLFIPSPLPNVGGNPL